MILNQFRVPGDKIESLAKRSLLGRLDFLELEEGSQGFTQFKSEKSEQYNKYTPVVRIHIHTTGV